jgi:hypothetical protein
VKQSANPRWIDLLPEEDLAFIKRFILASGSLKELAGTYGISYPTVRLRLDRLMAKIQVLEEARAESGFERVLRAELAGGKLDRETFQSLLAAHREEMERSHAQSDDRD